MEQILIAYDLPKETVTVIMMLNKKDESNGSLNGDTDFLDSITGVFHGDTSAL